VCVCVCVCVCACVYACMRACVCSTHHPPTHTQCTNACLGTYVDELRRHGVRVTRVFSLAAGGALVGAVLPKAADDPCELNCCSGGEDEERLNVAVVVCVLGRWGWGGIFFFLPSSSACCAWQHRSFLSLSPSFSPSLSCVVVGALTTLPAKSLRVSPSDRRSGPHTTHTHTPTHKHTHPTHQPIHLPSWGAAARVRGTAASTCPLAARFA
jgi:hypothetical protein